MTLLIKELHYQLPYKLVQWQFWFVCLAQDIIIAWPSKNTNISTAWPSKNATISLPEIKFNSQNKAMTTLKNSIIVN